jgi:hypothetical protein
MSDHAESGSQTPDEDHRHHEQRTNRAWWIFAAFALFYLLSEHRAHLFGILPYLLLLACPLMHMFMHKHHGGHGSHGHHKNGEDGK